MGKHQNAPTDATVISHPSQVPAVWEAVVEKMRHQQFPPSDIFAVQLALEEALTNAIKHGHQNDYSKQVAVEWTVDEHCVRLSIEDQGKGFFHEDVDDPTRPENIKQPGGRGLLFMHTYMCSVQYNDKGNRVEMIKHRTRGRAGATRSG